MKMSESNIQIEEQLFSQALEISNPEKRTRFVEEKTSENIALRTRIFRLIENSQQNQLFLDDESFAGEYLKDTLPSAEDVGDSIAGYELVRQIGEGGMGTVFLATQTNPVQRNVAIKILKSFGNSGTIAQRFEVERQTLALMNHPNITRIFDGGLTDSDRPFFVMEYVDGKDLLEYCKTENPSLRERLLLIKEIAHALHHAHLRGIIHRDIKPDNILIETIEGRPIPKIIDFGIARIADQDFQTTRNTYHGQLIGTLEYMSPEQLSGDAATVDARTDVYSLGSVFYKILTGHSPHTNSLNSHSTNLFNMIQVVQQSPIVKPSQFPSEEAHSIEPKEMSGEIDWILLKALEKDPEHRYESAKAFGEDIEHFLNGDLVQAAEPSMLYHLKKSYKRNKSIFLFSGAILSLLIVMAFGGTILALQANKARKYAEQQFEAAELARKSEKELRQIAEKERDRARIAEFEARELTHQRQMQLVESESQVALYEVDGFTTWFFDLGSKIRRRPWVDKFVSPLPVYRLETLPFDPEFTNLHDSGLRESIANSIPLLDRTYGERLSSRYTFKKVDIGKTEQSANFITIALEKRMEIVLKYMPPEDLLIAREYESLAVVYLSLGRFEETEDYLEKAMRIRLHPDNNGLPQNGKLAKLKNSGLQGLCRVISGDSKRGLPLLQECLDTKTPADKDFQQFITSLKKLLTGRNIQIQFESPASN